MGGDEDRFILLGLSASIRLPDTHQSIPERIVPGLIRNWPFTGKPHKFQTSGSSPPRKARGLPARYDVITN